MALEEVGTKLVAEGEQQFVQAMTNADKAIKGFGQTTVQTDKQVQKGTGGLKQFNETFKQITGISLSTAGVLMVAGAAVRGLVNYAKEATAAASDMNETISKSQVVFGASSKVIEEMGETASTSMGISKQEAIAAAATYGNLFTSLGLARDQSADMSAKMVQLASDLASFNNIPVADALEKIRAGLVGESEPLRALGININESTLKQEALNLGLKVGKGALDGATKAQAAYSLMLKQSSNAQGDFTRTADGAANQQRILEAQMKDLKVEIGKGLLPVWVELLSKMNEAVKTTQLLVTWQDQITGALTKHEREVFQQSKSYKDYNQEMIRAYKVTDKNIDSQGNLTTTYMGQTRTLDTIYKKYGILTEEQYRMTKAIKINDEVGKDWSNDWTQYWHRMTTDAQAGSTGTTDALSEVNEKLKEEDTLLAGVTARMLLQKAALDVGSAAWWEMSISLGLATEKQRENWATVKLWDDAYQEGRITLEEYRVGLTLVGDGIKALPDSHTTTLNFNEVYSSPFIQDYLKSWGPGDKTFTVTTKYTSTGPPPYGLPPQGPTTRQAGGPVMEGWPYWVGEKGPEPFIPGAPGYILSRSDAERIFARQVQAPSTISHSSSVVNNYNSTNAPAYNLSVMSSQSPAVVQRSFAMMKMLAG